MCFQVLDATAVIEGNGAGTLFSMCQYGGEGEIRTHGGISPSPVFKTGALNHSATSPETKNQSSEVLPLRQVKVPIEVGTEVCDPV